MITVKVGQVVICNTVGHISSGRIGRIERICNTEEDLKLGLGSDYGMINGIACNLHQCVPYTRKYQLLKYHMDCNPDYLFGHAEIAGLLANGDDKVDTYEKYKSQCGRRGVDNYSEELYNRFMAECNRIPVPVQEYEPNEPEHGYDVHPIQ